MDGLDKGLLQLDGLSFVQRLGERLRPWVDRLAISANRNQSRYRPWADAVLADDAFAGEGPLAGILRGLDWAIECNARQLLVAPCDTPGLPADFFAALIEQGRENPDKAVVARLKGTVQPLHALLPVASRRDLEGWLTLGRRDARGFVATLDPLWQDGDTFEDGFLNINRPADLRRLKRQWEPEGTRGRRDRPPQ